MPAFWRPRGTMYYHGYNTLLMFFNQPDVTLKDYRGIKLQLEREMSLLERADQTAYKAGVNDALNHLNIPRNVFWQL